LNQATEKSFIILDEIGRGTSTYDGLAIAWAVIEEIGNSIKARTIFATHYHELKDLKNTMKNIQFLTVKVEEWNNEIIFLHKIENGFASKSYGIQVASLAGFPQHVLNKAENILGGMR
jgi:DNA mismatch repair protein MutS